MAHLNRLTTAPDVRVYDTSRPRVNDLAAAILAIPQLWAWWDFEPSRLTLDTITTPGTTLIQGVADRSGNGHHLTTASAAKRPKLVTNALNGRPVAEFDHVAGNRLDGIGGFPTSGDHTKVVISKLSLAAANAVRMIAGTVSPAANGHQLSHTTAQRMFVRNAITSTAMQPTIGSRETQWQMYTSSQDVAGDVAKLRIGDLDVLTAAMDVTTSSGDIYIGQTGSGTQSYGGQIAAVLIFNGDLNAAGFATEFAKVKALTTNNYGDLP